MEPNTLSRRNLLKAGLFAGLSSFGTDGLAAQNTRSLQLTMLNSMAGPDFELAARRHVALGMQWLDLKDALWGQTINDISLESAQRVAKIAAQYRLGVFSLSTAICGSNIAEGETAFRKRHGAALGHVLAGHRVFVAPFSAGRVHEIPTQLCNRLQRLPHPAV